MTEKQSTFKSFVGTRITEIVVGLIVTVVGVWLTGILLTKGLSKEERNHKIYSTLELYATDVNSKAFDAYKYFNPKIERFYQMFDTSPTKVNHYISRFHNKQFQNVNMRFDKSTLCVKEIENEYEVLVIMYATYYKVSERKMYNNHRTKMLMRFDNDFRIKYLRQFFD